MPGENLPNDPAPSLRDIAEQAYDDLETGAAADESPGPEGPVGEGGAEEPLAQNARPRDSQGRWVAKSQVTQPGEAIEPIDPAPKPKPVTEAQAPKPPDPAAASHAGAKQSGPPEHWSAEDKATFAKLPPEGQSFLLKRHGEMEAEFTRKSQASAGAVQFTQSLAPVFNDPAIAQDLQRAGVNPVQAVHLWGDIHRRAVSPRQEDRFNVLVEMTQRMGLDPARIFSALQNKPPPMLAGLKPEDLQDPAIKFFADHIGRTDQEIQALRGELQQRAQAEQAARDQWALNNAKQGIDGFADEVDKDGRQLRPHFNAVLPILLDMFRANPGRDLAEAYETACWAHPDVRKHLLAAEHYRQQTQNDIAKARVAVRGNTRGVTTPVTRPNGADGPTKGGLRDAIERSADEVGF